MDLLIESYLRLAGLWDEVKDRLHGPASHFPLANSKD